MALKFNPFTGTFEEAGSGGGGPAFGIVQTPSGTTPHAAVSTDSLTLTSSDSSVTITGNSATDTVDFKANTPTNLKAYRPSVRLLDVSDYYSLPTGTSATVDGKAVANGDRVLFVPLGGKVYVAGGVGTALTWTLATDGQNGDGTPAYWDELWVTDGNSHAGTRFTYYPSEVSGIPGGGGPDWSSAFSVGGNQAIRGDVQYGQPQNNAHIQLLSQYGVSAYATGGKSFLVGQCGLGMGPQQYYGAAQNLAYALKATDISTTTDATVTALKIDGGYSTLTDYMAVTNTRGRPYKLEVEVFGVRTDVADTDYLVGTYFIYGYNSSVGVYTALGSQQALGTNYATTGAAGWVVDISDAQNIKVTGEVGKTIRWNAVVKVTGVWA